MIHRITLELTEATTEQLERALRDARCSGRKCDEQGSVLHTWDARAKAISEVLGARRAKEA